jgi:hypothetical protein
VKFQTLPVQVTGASYQSRSRPLSSQRTVNWYQQASNQAKDPFVLMPFPGLLFNAEDPGEDRGFNRMGETLYQVKGESLYFVGTNGRTGLQGTILGTDRCIMANDGENLFIVSSTGVYHYSTITGTINLVTDVNIVGAKSVDFINNQFLYTSTDFTTVSNVGDGTTANGLNKIGEETNPDSLVRDYVFDELIYRFGTRTTATWYNSGVGNPPIEKLQGRTFEVGLAAIHSVANTDNALYWLADDRRIYRTTAGAKEVISTMPISNEINGYAKQAITNIDDAIGSTFTIGNDSFYVLTFPRNDKTFLYNESLGELGWSELSSGSAGGRYQGNSFESAYGKTYVADVTNGNIYTLDLDTYTNNGDSIRRERVTGSVNGGLVGAPGARLQMSKAKFIMETGVGLIDGQGDNPRIMIEYSDDGGRSFQHGAWPRVGRLGEFTLQVEFFNLGTFYDRIFRISTSDNVNYSIFSGTINLRLAGN